MPELILLHITAPDQKVADAIADGLIVAKLAASVHYAESPKTTYWWQDRIRHNREIVLTARTRKENLEHIEAIVGEHHPYDVPEMFYSHIEAVSPDYLNWLSQYTAGVE